MNLRIPSGGPMGGLHAGSVRDRHAPTPPLRRPSDRRALRVTFLGRPCQRPLVPSSSQAGALGGFYAASRGYCALVWSHRIFGSRRAPAGVARHNPDSAVRALTTTRSRRGPHVRPGRASPGPADARARRPRTNQTGRPGRGSGPRAAYRRETIAGMPVDASPSSRGRCIPARHSPSLAPLCPLTRAMMAARICSGRPGHRS